MRSNTASALTIWICTAMSAVRDERDDRAHLQPALDREPAAAEPDERWADHYQCPDQSDEPAADEREPDLEIHELGAGFMKALGLGALARERFHQRDAGERQRFLDVTADEVALFPGFLAHVVHRPADGPQWDHHDRHDDKREKRQPPVKQEDGCERGDDGENV